MIPKKIHYCWLSNDPYPILIKHCIKHWQHILPDYEFCKWDLQRFPLTQSVWVKEAYENKKYAFAADYIRCYALYTEGGFYLDSDIWLKKSLDSLLDNRFVSCIEGYAKDGSDSSIQAAFMGCEKNHPLMRDILSYYDGRHFKHADGQLETSPIAPKIFADYAIKYGFQHKNAEQLLDEGIHIFDSTLCAPNSQADASNSVAIHFCEHTWHDENLIKKLSHRFRGLTRTIKIYLS